MLKTIEAIIDEAPPDTGPRRFGNISFRKWHEILASRVSSILRQHVPAEILDAGSPGEATAEDELTSYLLGGFGSSQRLDFGTGHELSFLAFLGGLWKLGGFTAGDEISDDGRLERSIVLGIFEPYLNVIRRLVLTYSLEPAGSHGVWGLDDHFFLSYIFGSAQYCPAIKDGEPMPLEGSLPGAPSPAVVTKKNVVDQERKTNMYFAAIGFIYDVKTGPFWEHSPILFDISGVRAGWGKVNKGMIKMYNAEVLSKFPVVQHFNFGSLFSFERDPNAAVAAATVHTSNQPSSHTISVTGNTTGAPTSRPVPQEGTRAPWATSTHANAPTNAPPQAGVATAAPWAKPSSAAPPQPDGSVPTRAPWAASGSGSAPAPGNAPTRAPWATGPRSTLRPAHRPSSPLYHQPQVPNHPTVIMPGVPPNAIANLKSKVKGFFKGGNKKSKATDAKPTEAAAAAPAAVAATATTDDKPTETAPVAAAPADTAVATEAAPAAEAKPEEAAKAVDAAAPEAAAPATTITEAAVAPEAAAVPEAAAPATTEVKAEEPAAAVAPAATITEAAVAPEVAAPVEDKVEAAAAPVADAAAPAATETKVEEAAAAPAAPATTAA
ncbi:hypothetical protein O988_03222 [Pseudogymnoascus sp. VKM F-3808]|nr:hypothetical protein O988_03222 [Pseudogymnoascus sp. VKM F-3808]